MDNRQRLHREHVWIKRLNTGAPNSINDRVERKKKDVNLVLSKKREFC